YAMVDGRIQVFEINTNPVASTIEALLPALRELDCSLNHAQPIPVTRRFEPLWEEHVNWAFHVSSTVHGLLRACRLLALEPRVQSTLRSLKRGLAKALHLGKGTHRHGPASSR